MQQIREFLSKPIDISSIIYFRIVFGLVMTVWSLVLIMDGDPYTLFTHDPYHFSYWGFWWLKPLSGDGMAIVYYLMLLASVFITIGYKYRLAICTLFLGKLYVFLLVPADFGNRPYFILLLTIILIAIPAHGALSVDAHRNKKLRSDTTPAWHLYLLRFQMAAVFFWAGIAKYNADWLSGYVIHLDLVSSPYSFLHWLVTTPIDSSVIAWAIFLFQLLITPFLLWKKTRIFAALAAAIFVSSLWALYNLGAFPWLVLFIVLLFFDPSWPRQVLNKLRALNEPHAKLPKPSKQKLISNGALVFILIYASVQLFLPLRQFIYPGNANWSTEGSNFSWKMFSKHKFFAADPRITVYDRTSGQTYQVHIPDYVDTKSKNIEFLWQPRLLEQFAHMVAKDYYANGFTDIEVNAIIVISLNEHRPIPLLDPTYNLLSEKPHPFRIKHLDWITPYHGEAYNSSWQPKK